MATADETLVAATAVLQNLARDESIPGSSSPPFDFQLSNGTKSAKLPGENSLAKAAFEAELEALVRRVHHLEFQAVSHHNFQQQADPPPDHTVCWRDQREEFLVDIWALSLVVRSRF